MYPSPNIASIIIRWGWDGKDM